MKFTFNATRKNKRGFPILIHQLCDEFRNFYRAKTFAMGLAKRWEWPVEIYSEGVLLEVVGTQPDKPAGNEAGK